MGTASFRILCFCALKLKALIKSPHGSKVYSMRQILGVGPFKGSRGMLPWKSLEMELSDWVKMHLLLIVTIMK